MANEREDGTGTDFSPMVKVAAELWNDPRTHGLIEQGMATLYPDRVHLAVPGYAIKQEFEAEKAELRKEREEYKAEREKDKADADARRLVNEWHSGLVKHGARPDEVPAMFKLATERKIGDPEAVVDQYRKSQKLAEPSSGRFQLQMPGAKAGEFFKGLDSNPDQWARERAHRDLDAIRAGRPLDPSPLG